jgi:hypothetical protein
MFHVEHFAEVDFPRNKKGQRYALAFFILVLCLVWTHKIDDEPSVFESHSRRWIRNSRGLRRLLWLNP